MDLRNPSMRAPEPHPRGPGIVRVSRWRWLRIGWLLPLVLVACRSTIVRTPEVLTRRVETGASGLIAFVGVDGNVYTIDQHGDRRTALTGDARLTSSPVESRSYQYLAWAPDSQRLAFVGIIRGDGETDRAVLYTAGLDGGEPVAAFTSQEEIPFYLYWSPDSEHISFLSTSPENTLNLHLLPASGGEGQILDTGQPYYWAWAPDGRRLLVHVGGAARGRLTLLRLSGDVDQQTIDLQPAFFQAPAWSPDGGKMLVAAALENEERALVLTERDGGLADRIVSVPGSVAFGWSADGKRLAYITSQDLSARGILGPLTVYDLEQKAETAKTVENTVYAFFWSPDGQKIAYFVPQLSSPGSSQEVVQRDHPVLLFSLNLLEVDSGVARSLAVFSPTEEFLQVLPYFDQYQRSSTLWSPDSRYLVLSRIASNNRPEIAVIPVAADQEPRKIADGVLAFWSWR